MQFRSPSDTPIHVALITGHAAIIGPEWRELPEHLHLAALSAGCECDKQRVVAKSVAPVDGPEAMNRVGDHDSVYRQALTTMLERNVEGDFTKDELPNINVVSKLAGISAVKVDVLRVFRAMTAEANAE